MQLIQFSNTGNDPTVGGTDLSRTITWAGSDGINFSQTVTTTVLTFASVPDHGSLLINGPSNETVVFASGNGTLSLNQPSTFTGEIGGISGNGDVLDMHGFNAATTHATTGTHSYNPATNTTTLTVVDTLHNVTETFKLLGDLSNSSWTVTDDQHGGANIVDPPAVVQSIGGVTMHDPGPAVATLTGTPGNDTLVSSAPNQTMTGNGGADNFVFNPSFGKDTITDYKPGVDTITINHTIFANAASVLAATSDDGHGNAVITADANDTITLNNVVKAQLSAHSSDFHFV